MDGIKEIIETLITLAQAQSLLCLLGSSWMFTIAWVFAVERKRGANTRLGRALWGVFWLPGLLAYYLLPDIAPEARSPISPTLGQTPTTHEAPARRTQERANTSRRREAHTWDGGPAVPRDRSPQPKQSNQETADAAVWARRQPDGARPSAAPADPAHQHQLRVLDDRSRDKCFTLTPGLPIHIGNARNNAIRLPKEEGIAGWHAVIEWREGDWLLMDADTGEAHPISVNGVAAQAKMRVLREGDVIKLGRIQLKFERSP